MIIHPELLPEKRYAAQPWWKNAVLYQVYPRSFQDTNGDGLGDLAGIIRRLDYLAELGVDIVWISPIYRSPQADNGYDISDYRDVDPLFGDLEAFDALVTRAHDLGMRTPGSMSQRRASTRSVETGTTGGIRALVSSLVLQVLSRQTGSRFSAGRRGSMTHPRASITFIFSHASSPI